MATEKLNITGWDSGWPTGLITNVDEAIADADGQRVQTSNRNDVVIFDFGPTTALTDGDTVTAVDITIRARVLNATVPAHFDVELLIGSVSQGLDGGPPPLQTFWSNGFYTKASWDADWTVAQLDGAQVKITSRQDSVSAETWYIDCIDLDITYTVNAQTVAPTVGALALSGAAPTLVFAGGFHQARPAAGTLALTGQSPTLNASYVVPKKAIRLRPTPSYLNPLEVRFNPDGWDSGWPTGFITNIDEPVASADGQTISSSIDLDEVVLDFEPPSSVLTVSDTVLSVTYLVRFRQPGITAPPGSINTTALIESVPVIGITETGSASFLDQLFAFNTLNQNGFVDGQAVPWTAAQLDTFQLRIRNVHTSGNTEMFVDAVDLIITYVPQSPLLFTPAATSIAFATTAPAIGKETITAPSAGSVALSTTTPTLFRTALEYPGEETLILGRKTPKRIVNFFRLPSLKTMSLSGKSLIRITNNIELPIVGSIALSGDAPTIAVAANTTRSPARRRLQMVPQAVLLQTFTNTSIGGQPAEGVYEGQAPTAVRTTSRWITVAKRALLLSKYAPVKVQGKVRAPAVRTLSLTPAAANAGLSIVVPVAAATIVVATAAPQLGLLPARLSLTGLQPTFERGTTFFPAAKALSLAAKTPIRLVGKTPDPLTGALQLTSFAPTFEFSNPLGSGFSQILSLTIDYRVEFIATPTVTLID